MKSGAFTHPVCVSYTDSTATVCQTTATQINTFDTVAAEYVKDVFNKLPAGDPNNAYALTSAGRSIFDLGKILARIDHNFSDKESLTFRYMHDSNAETDPYGYQVGAVIPYVSTTFTNMPGTNVMGRLTSVLSPSLLNEVAFAFTDGAKLSTPTGYLSKNSSPDVKVNLPFTSTLGNVPYLGFNGLSGVKGYGPYNDYSQNYNVFDNITKTIGRHTLGAGITYNYYRKSENAASANAGSFSLAPPRFLPKPAESSNAEQTWANFLLGNYATFTQTSLDLTPDMRQNEFEIYAQDAFRWTRNLTIDAGVRYSMFRVPYDDRNMLSNFDPNVFVKANEPTLNSAGTTIVAGTGNPMNGLIVNSGATVTGTTSPYGNNVSNEPGGRLRAARRFLMGSVRQRNDGYSRRLRHRLRLHTGGNLREQYLHQSDISSPISTLPQPPSQTPRAERSGPPRFRRCGPSPLPASLPYTQMWSLDLQHSFKGGVLADVGYYGTGRCTCSALSTGTRCPPESPRPTG